MGLNIEYHVINLMKCLFVITYYEDPTDNYVADYPVCLDHIHKCISSHLVYIEAKLS